MIPFAREPREKKIAAFINEPLRDKPGHRACLPSSEESEEGWYRPIFPTVLRESCREKEKEKGGNILTRSGFSKSPPKFGIFLGHANENTLFPLRIGPIARM